MGFLQDLNQQDYLKLKCNISKFEFFNKIKCRPNIEKKPMRNNSAYYLKKAKEKEQEVDRLLQLTISRVTKLKNMQRLKYSY